MASITAMSYTLSRCCQRSSMLQAIRLSFNKTTLHVIVPRTQQETSDFVGPDLWPPNSPDLNLVDYKIWDFMQQKVNECRINSVDELK